MKNKKFTLLFISLLLLAVLAGCASQSATAQTVEGLSAEQVAALPVHISVDQAYAAMQSGETLFIDVREQTEYDAGHLPGITLIPMMQVPDRLDEIPTDQQVIVTCHSGNRSGQVADFLINMGYSNVHTMDGGIAEWEASGYPVEK